MVRLTKPLETQADTSVESDLKNKQPSAQELSIIGNSHDKKFMRFDGSKLFNTSARRVEEGQSCETSEN